MLHRVLPWLKARPRLSIALGLILLLTGIFLAVFRREPGDLRYVAYLGRYPNPKTDTLHFDSLHTVVLKDYLEELNGVVRGVRFELVTFSNDGSSTVSDSLYRTVLADPKYALVIDNTWGAHLQPSAPAIRANGIPVIATNADKDTVDFGHNVVFLGHDDDVPPTLALFAAHALHFSKAIFIAERNYSLTARFWPALSDHRIAVQDSIFVSSDVVDSAEAAAMFARLRRQLKGRDASKQQLVILNAHGPWARRIIQFVDSSFDSVTILGGPFVLSRMDKADRARFGASPRGNRLVVLTTDPVDALLHKVAEDVTRYREVHPRWFEHLNAELYVKRCLDAVSIMRLVLTDTLPPREPPGSRSAFRQYFSARVPDQTLVGPYDLYEFDPQSRLKKDLYFDVYRAGDVSSHPRQLNQSGELIPNIRFGLDIRNVGEINFDRNTFHAEFYYWLVLDARREEDERLIQFRNLSRRDLQDTVLRREREDSLLYKLYRITGEFHADYDLRKYPLDRQNLNIVLEIVEPSQKMRISFDHDQFQRTQARMKNFPIPAWRILDFYVTVDNVISPGLHGQSGLADRDDQRFKTLTVHLPVKRKVIEPLVVVVLPLLMIGLAAITLLQVRDLSFRHVGEVSMGVFLSIVTYSIAYSSVTPNSDQLTRADYLLYATFLVVLANFLTIITLSSDLVIRWPVLKRLEYSKYVVAALYALAVAVIPFV